MGRFGLDSLLAQGLALMALAVCCGCGGGSASESLVGSYTRPHAAWVFHGNEPIEAAVEDRLILTPADSSTVAFSLQLIALDGTGCTLEGTVPADRSATGHRGEPCALHLEPFAGGALRAHPEPRCLVSRCPDFGTAAEGPFVPTTVKPILGAARE